MKTTIALLSLFFATSAQAFAPAIIMNNRATTLLAMQADMDEGPDFDAPASRAAAVGNAVRSPPKKNPLDFLMDMFAQNTKTAATIDDVVAMDDCYLGKDGTADECVDFDPPAVGP